ncbi:MAG TPA: nucleotidyltransferase family protein, partial [Candidatus Methylomirabilis sp.]|nr:nucleotidyltransferase family protein [Candidatus Methylomirabilis sp.]
MERSRTDDLLLAFLRTDPDATGAAGTGELSGTDWEDLLRTSARHGVAPLLYHRLTNFHRSTPVPPEVIRQLRNSYLQNAGRNMRLYHEQAKVLGRLRQDGIPVIALKGLHLAEAVYGNIALRPMGDADLLVKPTDLSRVQDLLVEHGYTASKEDTFCAQEHLPPYRKAGSPSIEIHINIVGPPFSDRVDVGKLFIRAQTCLIGGIEVGILRPE